MAQYTAEVKGFYPKQYKIALGDIKFSFTSYDYVKYACMLHIGDVVTVTFKEGKVTNIERTQKTP